MPGNVTSCSIDALFRFTDFMGVGGVRSGRSSRSNGMSGGRWSCGSICCLPLSAARTTRCSHTRPSMRKRAIERHLRATRHMRKQGRCNRSMVPFVRESGFYFFRRNKWPGVSDSKRGQATILLARRAPTIKRWSLDARSEGQFACPLWRS